MIDMIMGSEKKHFRPTSVAQIDQESGINVRENNDIYIIVLSACENVTIAKVRPRDQSLLSQRGKQRTRSKFNISAMSI